MTYTEKGDAVTPFRFPLVLRQRVVVDGGVVAGVGS